MANLSMSGVDCGQVLEYSDDATHPCMDTNYAERTLSFTVLKTFATYSAMVFFNNSTIHNYFSNRTKSISYGGVTISNCILQSFKRKTRINSLNYEYEIIFTKEG